MSLRLSAILLVTRRWLCDGAAGLLAAAAWPGDPASCPALGNQTSRADALYSRWSSSWPHVVGRRALAAGSTATRSTTGSEARRRCSTPLWGSFTAGRLLSIPLATLTPLLFDTGPPAAGAGGIGVLLVVATLRIWMNHQLRAGWRPFSRPRWRWPVRLQIKPGDVLLVGGSLGGMTLWYGESWRLGAAGDGSSAWRSQFCCWRVWSLCLCCHAGRLINRLKNRIIRDRSRVHDYSVQGASRWYCRFRAQLT